MAKRTPGVRLLRSLARAAKSQRTALARLAKAYATPPRAPAKRIPAQTTSPERRRPMPAPGRWLAGQYLPPPQPGQAVAQRMRYWLYLPQRPPDSAGRDGWPLVVMLHGCQQTATQFAEGTRMNRLADDKGYAVLYPQQSLREHAQRCWRWYDRSTQQGGGDTVALAALIGTVCEQYGMDRRRVYAAGLSAGAGMAAVLALNHPELIAAVGLHSGPVFGAGHTPVGALHVMRRGAPAQAEAAIHGVLQRRAAPDVPAASASMPAMPALLIQGDDDEVVHPVNQQQLARQWLQLNGLPADAAPQVALKSAGRGAGRTTYEIRDHRVGRKVLLRAVRVAGLRHAWSGGDPALRFNAAGGPDASRMMLDFFGRHRR